MVATLSGVHCIDEYLNSARDRNETVLVLDSDIPRPQPSVFVERLGRLLDSVQISHHDVSAFHSYLALVIPIITIMMTAVDFGAEAGQSIADGAQLPLAGPIGQLGARAFAHAVNLQNSNVEGKEKFQDVARKRRRGAEKVEAFIQAQSGFHFLEEQFFRQTELKRRRNEP